MIRPVVVARFGVVLGLVGGVAMAQTEAAPRERTISVSGEAVVNVVPDEVVVTLGLVSSNAELAVARQGNNDRSKGVLAVARALGILDRDIQTSFLSIEPRYKSDSSYNSFTVRRTMVITLKDIARFDEFVTRAAQNNRANRIEGIEFKTSQLRANRDKARDLAVRAAQQKAIALAAPLGAKIGRPITINEDGSGGYYPYYGGGGGFAQNAQVSVGAMGDSESSPTLAGGQIPIRARVTVVFELQ